MGEGMPILAQLFRPTRKEYDDIFFAVVLLGSTVGLLLLVGAWTAEGVLSVVERVAGRSTTRGRFDRLRQALRSVAVPAKDKN